MIPKPQTNPADASQHAQEKPWYNRPFHLAPPRIPPYKSPKAQLALLGTIIFCSAGVFAALSGLGGGGLGNPVPVNNSLVAIYSTLAVFGFFAGPICAKIGFRISLVLGSVGFTVYSACLLVYKHTQIGWVLILGGVQLGGLWALSATALGAMLMSYPTSDTKGKCMALNCIYYNGGAILGSLVVFLENLRSESIVINDATIIAFVVIMGIAVPLSFGIISPERVVRSDKSTVLLMALPSWNTAIIKFFRRLRSDPYIVAMFPMFFVSNFYLTYLFNDINLANFNIRTRALNVILFYAAGVPGAYLSGLVLDLRVLRRRFRARIAILMLLVLFMALWAGTYAWQRIKTRHETSSVGFQLIDCSDVAYTGPMFIFVGFGFVHFIFQVSTYWFLGALADSSSTAASADFAGFLKSVQSVGEACAWRLGNEKLPFLLDLGVSWGLVIGSLAVSIPVIIGRIKDDVIIDQTMSSGDQSVEGVEAVRLDKII